ncbi:MAG TPA: PQQ-binding-like beta-propeller repeat protein [Phycisphaerae bacterium]|jgi:hypothetical protein
MLQAACANVVACIPSLDRRRSARGTRISASTALGLLLCISAPLNADPTWQVFQLTSGAQNDFLPDVSGMSYVWQRGAGSSAQIMMWTEGGPAPAAISSGGNNGSPRINGQRVVWEQLFSGDYEIAQWLAGSFSYLTNNNYDDRNPAVGGTSVAWKAQGLFGIVFNDGQQQQVITAGDDNYPAVFNNWLTWEVSNAPGSQSQPEIFFWNGSGAPQRLTTNTYQDVRPQTDGSSIVWYAYNGPNGTSEIWQWTPGDGAVRLTTNSLNDAQPDVSGDLIVFAREVNPGNFEIFLRYLGVEYRITTNNYNDFEPRIDGDRIVWRGLDTGVSHVFYAIVSGTSGGQVAGACCVGLDCMLATQSECEAASGTFGGANTQCAVDSCGIAPANTWSTFQHDAQRTGRTAAVVPDQPNRIWSLLVGSDVFNRVAPTIAPDGTVYLASYPNLVAVDAEGTFRWQAPLYALASASIRQDGNLWLPAQDRFRKVNKTNGTELCNLPNISMFPAALDADGNNYVLGINSGGNPWVVRKIDPACGVVWTFNGENGAGSHVALGLDGGVYESSLFGYFKIDSANGALIWSNPTATRPGAPAIGPDGTIYCTLQPNQLLATHPDGSLAWTHMFMDPDFRPGPVSPAISSDGTIHVSGTYGGENYAALVAVTPAGDQQSIYVSAEVIQDALSPALDGVGKVLLPAGRYVIAVAPADGSELWRVDVGEGDTVNNAVAIAEDGTFFATTTSGYLLAVGSGCMEDPAVLPPYAYREVAEAGQIINGYTIQDFRAFEVGEDGLVAFEARVAESQAHAVFIEKPDGSFDTFARSTILDGQEIDSVSLPRRDSNGNSYMAANLVNIGPAIFVNNEVFLTQPPPSTPIAPTVLSMISPNFFDIDQVGNFLVYGKITAQSPTSAIRVRSAINNAPENLLSLGTTLDAIGGFSLTGTLSPKNRRQHNSSGAYVLADHDHGILVSGQMLVFSGAMLGDYTVSNFSQPQINESGLVHFRADHFQGNGVFATDGRRVGTGDEIQGFEIATVQRFDVNNANQLAHLSVIADGRRGVFTQTQAVAVANGSFINGEVVLDIYPDTLDQNEASQIAFTANVNNHDGVYIATPTGMPVPAFTFRRAMQVGDTIDGATLTLIREIELNNDGLVFVYVDALIGGVSRPAYIHETSLNTFDTIANGDVIGGLTVNTSVADETVPRVDDDGNVYLYVGTSGVNGPTLFRNGQPLVQRDVPGATAPVRLAFWPDDIKLFDVNDHDEVLLFGRTSADPSDAVLRIDALAGTASALFVDGTELPGWTIQAIDTGSLDERHVDNNTRTFVVHGNGRHAVMEDQNPYVRDGQSVNGHVFMAFGSPQVDGSHPVFIGQFAGGSGLFNAAQQFVATGDAVAGYTVQNVLAHSLTNGVSAFTAELSDGRIALFRGSALLAAEVDTSINGAVVQSIAPTLVRKNESGDVAFIATLMDMQPAAFVASGPDGAITFRRVAGVGDMIAGHLVATLEDVRLDDAGLVSFRSGAQAIDATLFRETSLGVFQTWSHGDQVAGQTLDFSLGNPFAPRVNATGTEFLHVPVAPVGPVVFVNGSPIAQQAYVPPPPGSMTIPSFYHTDYVDHDDSGRFLVYGQATPVGQPGILSVDTQNLTVTPLISNNQVINGFIINMIEPSPVQGYANDGITVQRVTNGQFAIATQTAIIARTGDVVDGLMLSSMQMPRRNTVGWKFFLDVPGIFGQPPGGPLAFMRGTGNVVAGQPFLGIEYFVCGSLDELIYSANLLGGRKGIYFNDDPVAIAAVTRIDDVIVDEVGNGVANARAEVSANAAGQIAFVARRNGYPYTLYLASRQMMFDSNGDGQINLPDFGDMSNCFVGPCHPLPPECNVFDGDGNCTCDLGDMAGFQQSFTGSP